MAWKDWVRTVEVEPSLYAADFSRLGEQIETLARAGVRVFHFDVGDGHFVPPITIGPIVLQSISPIVHRLGAVLDCHLMVENPEKHFEAVAEAGGDSVTVHFEACDDLPAVYRRRVSWSSESASHSTPRRARPTQPAQRTGWTSSSA